MRCKLGCPPTVVPPCPQSPQSHLFSLIWWKLPAGDVYGVVGTTRTPSAAFDCYQYSRQPDYWHPSLFMRTDPQEAKGEYEKLIIGDARHSLTKYRISTIHLAHRSRCRPGAHALDRSCPDFVWPGYYRVDYR